MNKEFVPYEQAMALKELGFVEPVIAYFKKEKYKDTPEWLLFPSGDPDIQIRYQQGLQNSHPGLGLVSAPTYSQAFRWFREKYKLKHSIDPELSIWVIEIRELKGNDGNPPVIGYPDLEYNSYEEAELACLIKLIEIVKNK